MHMEIQVALNFVISYLYNKLPRRRVNIFGEELEKALKDKFQGHWYPEKPFKGSAFRCLKTGDPTDAVLERAARESGVPIADILENLPNELSVWVDPGEVSYRIGEKGLVKILYSENSDNHEENTSADREVNKTFNPEAQCFADAVSTSLSGLSLSPKTSPPHAGSSPHSATSSTSPTYKGSPNPGAINGSGSAGSGAGSGTGSSGGGGGGGSSGGGGSGGAASGSATGGNSGAPFLQRTQAPLTFTTATFAQTKFGSTKLKTSSKRANSSSYRMSPTEFSNYIKQRAMQQQLHHGHPAGPPPPPNHFGPVSPARSLSPNPLGLGAADPFYFPSINGIYPPYNVNGHRNIFDAAAVAAAAQSSPHFHPDAAANAAAAAIFGAGSATTGNAAAAAAHSKFIAYTHSFYGGLGGNPTLPHHSPQPMQATNGKISGANETAVGGNKEDASVISAAAITVTVSAVNGASVGNVDAHIGGSGGGTLSPALRAVCASAPTGNSTTSAAVAAAAAAIASANNQQQQQQPQDSSAAATAAASATTAQATANNSKFELDGLNAFYSNNPTGAAYQQLLVAN